METVSVQYVVLPYNCKKLTWDSEDNLVFNNRKSGNEEKGKERENAHMQAQNFLLG